MYWIQIEDMAKTIESWLEEGQAYGAKRRVFRVQSSEFSDAKRLLCGFIFDQDHDQDQD